MTSAPSADLSSATSAIAARYFRHETILGMAVGEAVAGGVRTGEPCVKVFVRRKLAPSALRPDALLPRTALSSRGGSVRVDVEEILSVVAPPYPTHESDVLGDVDIAVRHVGSTRLANTASNLLTRFGSASIFRGRGQAAFLVSCNHVFAACNAALLGAPILQPDVGDGGSYPKSWVANLDRFSWLFFGPYALNRVDLARARLLPHQAGSRPEPFPFGAVIPPSEIHVGMRLSRFGRGEWNRPEQVVAVHARVKVDYWGLGPYGRDTVFVDQIVTNQPAAFGESGSVLADEDGRVAGILFAGAFGRTFFNYAATAGHWLEG